MPVVDASVMASAAFPDETSTVAARLLDVVVDEPMLVPPLFDYEMANIMVTAERKGRVTVVQRQLSLAVIAAIRFEVRYDGQDVDSLLEVGLDHRLTAYDAAYLSLAMATGEPLATLDSSLRKAAKNAGVALV